MQTLQIEFKNEIDLSFIKNEFYEVILNRILVFKKSIK